MQAIRARSRRGRLLAVAVGVLAAGPVVAAGALAVPAPATAAPVATAAPGGATAASAGTPATASSPASPARAAAARRPTSLATERSEALSRLAVNAAAPHAGRPEALTHPDADAPGPTPTPAGSAGAPAGRARAAGPAGPSATTPPPAGPLGIDVASFQQNVNWTTVAAANIVFAYSKATEGTYYTNPYFPEQYNGSYAAGLIHGAYHFAIPDNSTGAAQADYFVANGGGWSDDGRTLPGMLDFEYNPYGAECYGMTPAQLAAWVSSFDSEYLLLTGRYPMLYTTADFWDTCTGGSTVASVDPLLLAAWGPSPAPIPTGWTTQTIWQYTDDNPLFVDGEVFNGTLSELSDFAASGDPLAGPGGYQTVTPHRLMDTRINLGASGPLPPNGSVALGVLGQDGIPNSGVASVVLNVTAVDATAPGNVAVYAAGTPPPGTSNVNFGPDRTVANLVISSVGSDGAVQLTVQTPGTVQLVADVLGYVPAGTVAAPGSFMTVTPTRLLDTRSGRGPLAPDAILPLGVTGRAGVPITGVSAVLLNVTAAGATAGGNLTVYADGTTRPETSNLNFAPQTVANLVVAPIGSAGQVLLATQSLGSVQLIVDVMGYVLGGSVSTADTYVPVSPDRLVDTRFDTGAAGPVPPNGSVKVDVAGVDGIPGGGTAAVVVNVTAVNATADGNVAVFPYGSPPPGTSNVNFGPYHTVANLAVAAVGVDGAIQLTVQSPGTVQLIVDVVGYIATE